MNTVYMVIVYRNGVMGGVCEIYSNEADAIKSAEISQGIENTLWGEDAELTYMVKSKELK